MALHERCNGETLPERARRGQEGDPSVIQRVIPSGMPLAAVLATATAHSALARSLGLTRVMRTPGTAGKHCWHSWKKLLARRAQACAQSMLPAHMTFTPRARFAHLEHNLTHTCLARPFLERREAREGLVPGALMSHPTPDVTWMPCTGTLHRNPPKCGPMGTLYSSCECHTCGSWWGEDSSTPTSPRAGGPQHPAGSDPALR